MPSVAIDYSYVKEYCLIFNISLSLSLSLSLFFFPIIIV